MKVGIGYHKKKRSINCSRTSCEELGKIIQGQIYFKRIAEQDDKEFPSWYHLGCYSVTQRNNVKRMFSSATELPGYADLTMADKIKVAEWFGWPVPEFNTPEPVLENHSLDDVWTDEVQGTTMSDELSHPLSPPAKPRTHDATSSPPSASGISLNGNKERPSRHVLQVALSSLYAGGSSFSPPTSLTNGGDEQESTVAHNRDLSSLYDRLSPNAAVTAPKSAGLVGINSFDRESTPLGPGSGKRGVSLHEMELMLLELEEREARARIATAELEVAKYQVKVEAARHAVIEQRVRIARAKIAETIATETSW